MFTDEQLNEIVELLTRYDENTKIYLGCDSVVHSTEDGKKFAKYATVAIIHLNGKHGCKIFSQISKQPDYDLKKDRPKMRMMNEVMKVCELYNELAPLVDEYDISIHLDINTDEKHGSSCAVKEAAGYVLGVTGLPEDKIKFKPDSWASSFGADRVANKGHSVYRKVA
jgi:predicted RNase H-related nuclease YkuK (DUF458 family)